MIASYDSRSVNGTSLFLKSQIPYAIPHSQDDGYWRGVKVRTGEEGVFPGNYVAEQHPTSTPTTMVRLSTLVRFGCTA